MSKYVIVFSIFFSMFYVVIWYVLSLSLYIVCVYIKTASGSDVAIDAIVAIDHGNDNTFVTLTVN